MEGVMTPHELDRATAALLRRVMVAGLAAAVLCWCGYLLYLAYTGVWVMLRTLGVTR